MTEPPNTKPHIFGNQETTGQDTHKRLVWPAVKKGMRGKCPNCGQGNIFKKYTTINDNCSTCHLDFTGHQADDAPPYFTMVIAGHIIIPIALETQIRTDLPMGLQFLLWGVILLVMSLWLLPITKGALINLQWANRMHGFSTPKETDPEDVLIPDDLKK